MFDYYNYFKNKGNHPAKEDILKLEDEITFDYFDETLANQLVDKAIEYAKKYEKPVSVRCTFYGKVVERMNNEGKEWLDRKEKVVEATHHSSYYVFLDSFTTHQYDEMIQDESYGVCGGGFPIIVKGEYIGSFVCTGLRPNEDHDVSIHALRQ